MFLIGGVTMQVLFLRDGVPPLIVEDSVLKIRKRKRVLKKIRREIHLLFDLT